MPQCWHCSGRCICALLLAGYGTDRNIHRTYFRGRSRGGMARKGKPRLDKAGGKRRCRDYRTWVEDQTYPNELHLRLCLLSLTLT